MPNQQEIAQRREALKACYPDSDRWHRRVDQMKESQVTAIYMKFQSEGKLR